MKDHEPIPADVLATVTDRILLRILADELKTPAQDIASRPSRVYQQKCGPEDGCSIPA